MSSPRVAFVILDGMPARHVGPNVTPALAALEASAVGVAVMTSATYPNHATFVTGTDPQAHGLFANWVMDGDRVAPAHRVGPATPTLFDAAADAGRDTEAIVGDHHLIGVMGARRATRHWPPDGRIPEGAALDRYGYAADDEVVDRILSSGSWDLLVGHLNEPDTAGHIDGPDSPAALDAYRATDAALGRIIDGLQPIWDSLVLIVVSDHDQLPVDLSLAPVVVDAPPGVIVIPEGSAAVVFGADADAPVPWLDDADGVAGHSRMRSDVRIAWAEPGRMFAIPAGLLDGELRGHHGGAETRDQVVAIGGGHPLAHRLAEAVAGTTPAAEDWAPTIAALLALDLPSATGRSLLP
jgi:arylsulfatase A-like enzyme